MTFFLVKRGIQRNDAAAIRPYLGDRVFAAVSSGIAQAKSLHQHALLESLNVRAVHRGQRGAAINGQRIDIHFDLVYRARMLDESNHVLSDEGEDQRHGERWTFMRGAAARTPENGGVTASRCPACGAELRLNLDGTCTHCRASVTNGIGGLGGDGRAERAVHGLSPAIVLRSRRRRSMEASRTCAPRTRLSTSMRSRPGANRVPRAAGCVVPPKSRSGTGVSEPGRLFRVGAQLETLAAEGRRNVMENLAVRDVSRSRADRARPGVR